MDKKKEKKPMAILLMLPIFIGIILFCYYCSSTPKYSIIYNNEIISYSNNEKTNCYNAKDDDRFFNYFVQTTIVDEEDMHYTKAENDNCLVIDIASLRQENNKFNNFMCYLYIDAYLDVNAQVPVNLNIYFDDDVIVEQRLISSSAKTTFIFEELAINNCEFLRIQFSKYAGLEGNFPIIFFGNTVLMLYGEEI